MVMIKKAKDIEFECDLCGRKSSSDHILSSSAGRCWEEGSELRYDLQYKH
jgi:hypothetical protein